MPSTRMPARGPEGRPPWTLFPKIVCVALLLGGFTSVAVLILAAPLETPADWQALVDAVGRLFVLLIVPTSFLTVVFSLLLFWRSRRWFLTRRWARAKLVLLVLTLPALHLLARGVFTAMRHEVEQGMPAGSAGPTGSLRLFTGLVYASIAVLLAALWLARFKPRLGQRPPSA